MIEQIKDLVIFLTNNPDLTAVLFVGVVIFWGGIIFIEWLKEG